MAMARDWMRHTIRIRKEQARRNAEALAEEEERQRKLPGNRNRAAKMERPSYEDKALEGPPQDKAPGIAQPEDDPTWVSEDDTDWLAGVPFASTRAYQLAFDAGLSRDDFTDLEPSGKTGFTTPDVRTIMEAMDDE